MHNPTAGPAAAAINGAAPGEVLALQAQEDSGNPGTGFMKVVIAGGASTGADRELVVTSYRAKAADTGFSIGDTITATRVLDVTGSSATQIGATAWYNETTAAALASAPSSASLEVAGTVGLTDAQLRAAAVPVVAGGYTAAPNGSFTRPADTTAYAVGDLVANNTTAASVVAVSITAARVSAGSGIIRRAQIRSTSQTLTNASYRLHLYSAQPAVSTVGDNAAIVLNDFDKYLGSIDVSLTQAFSGGTTGSWGTGIPAQDIAFKLGSGQAIYALLEARAARTPASAEVFTIVLDIIQD